MKLKKNRKWNKQNKNISFSKETVILIKKLILSEDIKLTFRNTDKDFTRIRKLTFDKMLILLLQKWVKSLQLRLNEFSLNIDNKLLSNSAFTQARSKLQPEVFDYLNIETILHRFYDLEKNNNWYSTFYNYRILAIDWSKIRLPNEKEIIEKYWKIKNVNRNNEESYYTWWILSVLHDTLNNLAIDYILEWSKYPEIALAIRNIQNLENTVKIRLIRVILDTWEIEVLATSLLDEVRYKNEDFKELYYKRWWVELYYDIIKNRLWLENFSWLTVNAILQDLSSTIFLSNFETIITNEVNNELEEKTDKKSKRKKSENNKNMMMNKQKVNKNISFNTIKNTLIELFLKQESIDDTMIKITELLKTNTIQVRPWRTNKRQTTVYKSLNFNKRKMKHCF